MYLCNGFHLLILFLHLHESWWARRAFVSKSLIPLIFSVVKVHESLTIYFIIMSFLEKDLRYLKLNMLILVVLDSSLIDFLVIRLDWFSIDSVIFQRKKTDHFLWVNLCLFKFRSLTYHVQSRKIMMHIDWIKEVRVLHRYVCVGYQRDRSMSLMIQKRNRSSVLIYEVQWSDSDKTQDSYKKYKNLCVQEILVVKSIMIRSTTISMTLIQNFVNIKFNDCILCSFWKGPVLTIRHSQ